MNNPFNDKSILEAERLCWMSWEQGKQAGIKEVVESVNLMLKLPHITLKNVETLWQSELKEWGIE